MKQDILLCQITSQEIKKDIYSIELKDKNLKTDSYIRCNMLFTAEKTLIKKKIGMINKNKYLEVIDKILDIIKPT